MLVRRRLARDHRDGQVQPRSTSRRRWRRRSSRSARQRSRRSSSIGALAGLTIGDPGAADGPEPGLLRDEPRPAAAAGLLDGRPSGSARRTARRSSPASVVARSLAFVVPLTDARRAGQHRDAVRVRARRDRRDRAAAHASPISSVRSASRSSRDPDPVGARLGVADAQPADRHLAAVRDLDARRVHRLLRLLGAPQPRAARGRRRARQGAGADRARLGAASPAGSTGS